MQKGKSAKTVVVEGGAGPRVAGSPPPELAKSIPLASGSPHAKDKNKEVKVNEQVKVEINQQKEDKPRITAKQDIFGGSPYSKAFLRGGERDGGESVATSTFDADINSLEDPSHPKDSLQKLDGAHRLFFRKCKEFPFELNSFQMLKDKREVCSSTGRVIYYTGRRGICWSRCLHSEFEQEVIDSQGKSLIIAKGRQFIFGINSKVEIFLKVDKLLGTMTQSCCNSTYDICDAKGRIVYKIQAPCFAPCAPFVFWCCNEHFEICMDDGVSEIGVIRKYWDAKSIIPDFQSSTGIEVDKDRVDDVRVKALLLGCYFLIEFQYYRRGGNGPFYFIVMLLIFAAILAVSECFGYCPYWIDKTLGFDRPQPV